MPWREKSYEVLPALRVRGRALRQSLRTITVAWMFGVVWMTAVGGSQMTSFCWMLGFKDFDFGLMAAIPFAATLAQLIAAMMLERWGARKYQFIYFMTAHRLLWIVIAAIPLLLRPGRATVWMFLGTYAVSSLLTHLSGPSWQTWMGDLIPRRIRGRYFSLRRVWTIPFQVAMVVLAGVMLDRATIAYPRAPDGAAMASSALAQGLGGPGGAVVSAAAAAVGTAPMSLGARPLAATQPTLLLVVCGLFAVAGVMGAIDVLLFLRIREIASPELAEPIPPRRRRTLRDVGRALAAPLDLLAGAFRDRVFRHYALYGATITFAQTVSGNYFWTYTLKNVGYTKLGANVIFQVCGAMSGMVMVRWWGRALDVWGRRPVLILSTIGVIFGPAGWFFIVPGRMGLAYVLGAATCMWGGVMWGALNLAQQNVILGFSDSTGRNRFVAAAAVVSAVGGFLGGLTGGYLAETLRFLQAAPLHVGAFRWNNYHITFLVSAAARLAAIVWLVGMPDPRARSFRGVLHELRFEAFSNVATRLFWRVRTLAGRAAGPAPDQAPRPPGGDGPPDHPGRARH